MPLIVDLLLHLDTHLPLLLAQYGGWTYLLLFLVVFLETGLVVTPFLPGDSLLFAAGTLAALGAFEVGWLWGLLCGAAVLGDTVNYHLGAALGAYVVQRPRWFLNPAHVARTQRFYARHGGKTIVLARFFPILRTFAPFVAGIGRMAYPHFAFYNLVGGLVWTGLFVFGGYAFGSIPLIQPHIPLVLLALMVLPVCPLLIELLRSKFRGGCVRKTCG
jgi:membrane-associated protein